MKKASSLALAALLLAVAAAACAPKAAGPDPHEATIVSLTEENVRLKRENDALKLRYEGPPSTPAPPIETRCAKAGDRWKITSSGRNELAGNTAGLRRDLRPTPVFGEGGKFVGFRIGPLEATGIGISCGLENGDVILKVNGAVPSAVMEMTLKSSKRVEIELIRGDQGKTIVIDIAG